MSTNSPAVSKRPSMSRRLRPLSMTCVRPSARGFPGRGGRSRKPSLESGIELLQLLLGAFLDVVEHGISVAVDSDGERTEVLDAELPKALGHELLPGDLLDLLDLSGLERRRASDDGEVDHAVAAHRLDRFVGQSALATDGADAVVPAQRLGEAHHARARGSPDRERLVAARAELADTGSRMQEEGAREVHRWRHAVVEDADLRPVAEADHVPVDEHGVAGAQLADLLFRRRKGQADVG